MSQDRDHYRTIGAKGGRATVARHGREHMSRIGKRGFAAAMDSVGGVVLWKHLQGDYHAKFGATAAPRRTIDREEYRRRRQVREAARREQPTLLCDVCGAEGEHHHEHGCDVPDANDHVRGLCRPHHVEAERQLRQQRWEEAHR